MIQFIPNTFLPNRPFRVNFVDGKGVITCTELYQINPKHRDGSKKKSQWLIKNHEEAGVFGWSLEHKSQSGEYYWGVFFDGYDCCVLGRTEHNHPTKIARFESNGYPRIWHGYPVDYINDPQNDCPHRKVLLEWVKLGVINKSKIAKLIGGQGWKD